MDPNTLSMEQGKQFLRQCGIPQRDIDLMTEKWIVIASVEVLLRFPLMPGEDPAARCVSNKKCQPSVDQPSIISQRCGDQEERKYNNQSMSTTDQKPKNMMQMSAHYIHHQPQRPAKDRKPKKQQRGPVGLRAPPPEEEDTMVKCKNCSAFGHTARSKKCPIKSWGRALPFQPLGSNKEKENLKPRKPQQFQTLRPVSKMEGQDQRQRQEEQQRMALPQRSLEKVLGRWQEPTESCGFLRQPTRPLPVQTTKKRPAFRPVLAGLPPVKTANMRPFCPTQSYNRKPGMSTCGPTKGREVAFPDCPHPASNHFCQDTIFSSKPTANKSGLFSRDVAQPAMKTPARGHAFNPQEHIKSPNVDLKFSAQPVRQKCGQVSKLKIQAPGNKSARAPVQTYQNQPKKKRLSSFPTPQVSALLPDLGAVQVPLPPPIISGVGPKQAPKAIAETATWKPRVDLQPLLCSPFLSPAQDCAVSQPLQSSHVPGEPQGTGSRRWDKCGHSTRLSMAPTCSPPESPQVSKESEGLGSCTARSVLYEDLLVSSSSEDSDGE